MEFHEATAVTPHAVLLNGLHNYYFYTTGRCKYMCNNKNHGLATPGDIVTNIKGVSIMWIQHYPLYNTHVLKNDYVGDDKCFIISSQITYILLAMIYISTIHD